MKKILPLLLVVSLPCAAVSAAPPAGNTGDSPALSIPKAGWVPIFFESINERAAQSGLSRLQKTVLPKDDLEMRVWEGFGLTDLQGYVLRRTKGVWSATELLPVLPKYKIRNYKRLLPAPKSGWTAIWTSLEAQGLLVLPDASTLKGAKLVAAGTSYVVEILNGNKYRTYHYNTPDYQSWPQAKQMLSIAHVLHREFALR